MLPVAEATCYPFGPAMLGSAQDSRTHGEGALRGEVQIGAFSKLEDAVQVQYEVSDKRMQSHVQIL